MGFGLLFCWDCCYCWGCFIFVVVVVVVSFSYSKEFSVLFQRMWIPHTHPNPPAVQLTLIGVGNSIDPTDREVNHGARTQRGTILTFPIVGLRYTPGNREEKSKEITYCLVIMVYKCSFRFIHKSVMWDLGYAVVFPRRPSLCPCLSGNSIETWCWLAEFWSNA